MLEQWIEEFLFRGRPPSGPGSEVDPEFHVIVGQQAPNPFDPSAIPARQVIGPLTPAQADAIGLPLTAIIADINAQAISEVLELRAELQAVRAELSQKVAEERARANHAEAARDEAARATGHQAARASDG